MKSILILPKINIQNANALSSPYTIGFPAMTAWLGATHALERRLKENFPDLTFRSTGVVSHTFKLHTHKGNGDYVFSIIGSGNPLVPKKKKKKGEPWESFERAPFIEEARCNLSVSLIVEFTGVEVDDYEEFIEEISHKLNMMKVASGDILSFEAPWTTKVHDKKSLRKVTRKLMPGYCIVERRDLMVDSMEKGDDAMDALLDHLKVFHASTVDENEKVTWVSQRKEPGWIVPMSTGFLGLTELGYAKNLRDSDTPHRFAESVVTLGEFIMPYRIDDLDNMLWHYHFGSDSNLYLCKQNKPITKTTGEKNGKK